MIPVADSWDPQSTSQVSVFLLCMSLQLTKVIFEAEFTSLQQKQIKPVTTLARSVGAYLGAELGG